MLEIILWFHTFVDAVMSCIYIQSSADELFRCVNFKKIFVVNLNKMGKRIWNKYNNFSVGCRLSSSKIVSYVSVTNYKAR